MKPYVTANERGCEGKTLAPPAATARCLFTDFALNTLAAEPGAAYQAAGDSAQPGAPTVNGRRSTAFAPVLLLPEPWPNSHLRLCQHVMPVNGLYFRLPQLYELLRCRTVEVVPVGDTATILIIDEEGSFPTNRRRNPLAEAVWWTHVPEAAGQPLYGRALWCHTRQFR